MLFVRRLFIPGSFEFFEYRFRAEGFLFQGTEAERRYYQTGEFEFISSGGYFHSLPQDPLRQFMDRAAEAQRAMGFCNEKDHPEVAPSQFEMNFGFSEAVITGDIIQLYKLTCRQVAQQLGMTASFLPKPVEGINGNGMHANISLTRKGKNIFYDPCTSSRGTSRGPGKRNRGGRSTDGRCRSGHRLGGSAGWTSRDAWLCDHHAPLGERAGGERIGRPG